MQRLEQALSQQESQMAQAEVRLTSRRAALLALETRVASVRKLMERRSKDLRRNHDRQEQRLSDDAAQHPSRIDSPLSSAWSGHAETLPLAHH
jgi:flagellar FliJ protein